MELLRRSLGSRGWLDGHDHALIVAVSRLTPGPSVLAYCVALGWSFHRLAGATAALIAASVPSAIVASVLSFALVRVDRYTSVRVLLAIAALVASWLVFASAWQLVRPYVERGDRLRAAAFVGIAVLLFLLGVTPVRVLLLAAAVGFLTPQRRGAPGRGGDPA
jgi:chromate transport protein ChrA